jgi:hypothetical protein
MPFSIALIIQSSVQLEGWLDVFWIVRLKRSAISENDNLMIFVKIYESSFVDSLIIIDIGQSKIELYQIN